MNNRKAITYELIIKDCVELYFEPKINYPQELYFEFRKCLRKLEPLLEEYKSIMEDTRCAFAKSISKKPEELVESDNEAYLKFRENNTKLENDFLEKECGIEITITKSLLEQAVLPLSYVKELENIGK